jgi:hypothetical protein
MFLHRADLFHRRQGWAVSVDKRGEERDDCDAMNPLYVIWETPQVRHGGSMRFLPTVGPSKVNEHFAGLTDGVHIASPLIWECTRFCLASGGGARTSAALMQLGGEIMDGLGLAGFRRCLRCAHGPHLSHDRFGSHHPRCARRRAGPGQCRAVGDQPGAQRPRSAQFRHLARSVAPLVQTWLRSAGRPTCQAGLTTFRSCWRSLCAGGRFEK